MSTSEAWLIECDDHLAIAVADRDMVELVPAEQCQSLSGAPDYCSSILEWHDLRIPVMDIRALHYREPQTQPGSYLCLLNYRASSESSVQQMALRVLRAPERILVDDAQFCEFPRENDNSLLKAVTLSCFSHHAKTVLILDISRLCSNGFRDLAGAA